MIRMSQKSSFASLQEIFTLPRQDFFADKEPNQPKTKTQIPTTDTGNSNICNLIKEAKTALEKLEQALSSNQKSTINNDKPQICNLQSEIKNHIDGVFDGKNMILEDGKLYPVPVNYASKSKLVEGDMLQLSGSKYKQISRVERKTISAQLTNINGEFGTAVSDTGESYKILFAPLKFFKKSTGDILQLEIPSTPGAIWAAVVGK